MPAASAPCPRTPPSPAGSRVEQPAAALAGIVAGYRFHAPSPAARTIWSLPAEAAIRIALDDRPAVLTIGRRRLGPLDRATVIGPTSFAACTEDEGGGAIVIALAATGWARLGAAPAQTAADDAMPLARMIGAARADALLALVDTLDLDAPIAPRLDAWLHTCLAPPPPDAMIVARCAALLAAGEIDSVVALAEALGIDQPRLRRLALQHFGFPAKRLLRRARFLRSLHPYLGTGARSIAAAYFDLSHFLRESREFLGMTPRQFAALAHDPPPG